MTEEIENGISPSLPLEFSVPLTLLLLMVLVIAVRRVRCPPATFVMAACWIRTVASIFHTYSFDFSPLGPRWNALVSFGMIMWGLTVLRPRLLTIKLLLPVYAIAAIAALSALANNAWSDLAIVFAKFGYLLVIALCTFDALRQRGDRFAAWLLVAFAPLFAFQLVSVIIGQTRGGETDGSASYVGGYYHEGAFSIALCTALVVAGLSRSMPDWLRVATIAASSASIILANYRTAILAFLPFLIVLVMAGSSRRAKPAPRAALLAATLAVAIVMSASLDRVQNRFSDLAYMPAIYDALDEPADFSPERRRFLSGRPYLWARYIDAWWHGPAHFRLIGAGPEARLPDKDSYPHNTFVSALYEYGALGPAAFIALLIVPIAAAWRLSAPDRAFLLGAHVSFFLLNLATMPFWLMEGNILYGLVLGHTFHAISRSVTVRPR